MPRLYQAIFPVLTPTTFTLGRSVPFSRTLVVVLCFPYKQVPVNLFTSSPTPPSSSTIPLLSLLDRPVFVPDPVVSSSLVHLRPCPGVHLSSPARGLWFECRVSVVCNYTYCRVPSVVGPICSSRLPTRPRRRCPLTTLKVWVSTPSGRTPPGILSQTSGGPRFRRYSSHLVRPVLPWREKRGRRGGKRGGRKGGRRKGREGV